MKADKKGYLYSIITAGFVLLLLSTIVFYNTSRRIEMKDISPIITTDELHYFILSVKNDLQRIIFMSGKEAINCSVNYILSHDKDLSNYEMNNCTRFKYYINGSEAAVAELMLCGTIDGNVKIKDKTIQSWIKRINETAKDANIIFDKLEVSDIKMGMYDSFHVGIIVYLDIEARDKYNISSFKGYGIPSDIVLININETKDPLYYLNARIDGANHIDALKITKFFRMCYFPYMNGSIINKILSISADNNYRCYFTSNMTDYGYTLNDAGPSFFDRLDGNKNLSLLYTKQSEILFGERNIGLESFINVSYLQTQGIPVDFNQNYTWIDYIYWRKITNSGNCCVNYTNPKFRIDRMHTEDRYNIQEHNCDTPPVCVY